MKEKEDNLIVNGEPYQQTPREIFQSWKEEKQSRSCVHIKCTVAVACLNTFLGKLVSIMGLNLLQGPVAPQMFPQSTTVHDSCCISTKQTRVSVQI